MGGLGPNTGKSEAALSPPAWAPAEGAAVAPSDPSSQPPWRLEIHSET